MMKYVTTFQGGTARNALAPKCSTEENLQYDFSSNDLNLRPIIGEDYPYIKEYSSIDVVVGIQ